MSPGELQPSVGLLGDGPRGGQQALAPNDSRLSALVDAAARLRGESSADDALEGIPRALTTAGMFSRVLVSSIDETDLVPWHWSSRVPPADDALEAQLLALRVPLRPMIVETEVVRRRISQRVEPGQLNTRTFAPFVDLTRTRSYVVAPIVVSDDVIAVVHADHGGNRRPVSESDHDALRHFTDLVGMVIESISIEARIEQEREDIRIALSSAQAELSLPVHVGSPPPVALDRGIRPAPIRSAQHPWGLSDRELAVLELVVIGRTNQEIAARLFLSESTVKSHVKSIFRKQGVTTRTEAISRVLRQGRWSEQRAS